jgi:2-keto-4-pentenoate hydratase/2-oxohepta-3-ene-1,7-dioic acid hydratase in catechol pathway
MHFMRVGPATQEIPVVVDQEITYDLRPVTADIDPAFLAADGLARARASVQAGDLPAVDTSNMRIGAPVSGVRSIICIGQNYAAHAAESGSAPPEEPIVFFKHPGTVVGPNDEIHPIPDSSALDWEVELAVVLKKRARRIRSAEEAIECIGGITISNDVSDRYWQIERSGGQWSKGKSWETFNPLGPYLVPVESEADISDLRLQSWVNGEIRQDSSTKDMIFSVADIIQHLSQVMLLDAGDVINTGTPQGVALSGRFPYLVNGDVVRLAITGLGEQESTIVDSL